MDLIKKYHSQKAVNIELRNKLFIMFGDIAFYAEVFGELRNVVQVGRMENLFSILYVVLIG